MSEVWSGGSDEGDLADALLALIFVHFCVVPRTAATCCPSVEEMARSECREASTVTADLAD